MLRRLFGHRHHWTGQGIVYRPPNGVAYRQDNMATFDQFLVMSCSCGRVRERPLMVHRG